MQTFTAKRVDHEDHAPIPRGSSRKHGIRAPGRIVMVVRQGSYWVQLQDGGRENFTAESVVIWEPGDWVEWGINSGERFKADSYWQDDLSEEEWKAVFADAFGPDAVS